MLDVRKIFTGAVLEEDWHRHRLGKVSASSFGKLISDKSHLGIFSKGAITYLEKLAYERINQKRASVDFRSDATDYGNAYEPDSIEYFQEVTGRQVLKNEERGDTHRWVDYNDYAGCTPDALIALAPLKSIFDDSGYYLKVATGETKSPPVHFLKYYKCLTPEDLKKVHKDYYWQKIFQMICCDVLLGFWWAYHPDFNGEKQIRIIEFKKMALIEDFRKAKLTLDFAIEEIKKTELLFKKQIA